MRLLFLLVVSINCTVALAQTPFAQGYEMGYEKGYCLEKVGCVTPISPIPPIPEPSHNSYSDGYARGIIDGSRDRENGVSRGVKPISLSSSPKKSEDPETESFQKRLNEIAVMADRLYAELPKLGSKTYFPKDIKVLKKLKIEVNACFESVKIDIDQSGETDPMYLGHKLKSAFVEKGILVSPSSPYEVSHRYSYRPDLGCGGVVISDMIIVIKDTRTSQRIADIRFNQNGFEGKCIDDVIYQAVDRLLEDASAHEIHKD